MKLEHDKIARRKGITCCSYSNAVNRVTVSRRPFNSWLGIKVVVCRNFAKGFRTCLSDRFEFVPRNVFSIEK